MLTSRQLRSDKRRVQRKAQTTKGLTDDDFFGTKGKTPIKSDNSSTTHTQPSQDETPLVVPDGNIKMEDQTVSEILSMISAE